MQMCFLPVDRIASIIVLAAASMVLTGCGGDATSTSRHITTSTTSPHTVSTNATTTRPSSSPSTNETTASSITSTRGSTSTIETTASSTTKPTTTHTGPMPELCLCVFDVDRTLTAMQKNAGVDQCQGQGLTEYPNVVDTAYGSGTLRISELGSNIHKTFCGKCFHAIVSRGDPLPAERGILVGLLGGIAKTLDVSWMDTESKREHITSPLVLGEADGQKHRMVEKIVQWFRSKGVAIPNEKVHFFDDKVMNIKPFADTPFNAVQVSCTGRDEPRQIGICGATIAEVTSRSGVHLCGEDVQHFVV